MVKCLLKFERNPFLLPYGHPTVLPAQKSCPFLQRAPSLLKTASIIPIFCLTTPPASAASSCLQWDTIMLSCRGSPLPTYSIHFIHLLTLVNPNCGYEALTYSNRLTCCIQITSNRASDAGSIKLKIREAIGRSEGTSHLWEEASLYTAIKSIASRSCRHTEFTIAKKAKTKR